MLSVIEKNQEHKKENYQARGCPLQTVATEGEHLSWGLTDDIKQR
jgi:hypothetical protein